MALPIPIAPQDHSTVRRLQRRDRNALLLHALSLAAVVLAGEAAAFNLDLAERFGFAPLLLRGTLYLLLSTALWAALLRANRDQVIGLMNEKQQGYESVLLAYDSAIALKDTYTGGHGRRVARYARLIAKAVGLPDTDVDSISEAALLHDIGKIGIPDRILTKAEGLTIGEFAAVQKHPATGANILRAIPLLSRHAMAVRHHHERFDGSGYPDGLRGNDIPLASRIIAIADAFDAMSSNRSYRSGISADRALDEIARTAGSHFDPEIAAAITSNPARNSLLTAHGRMS